MYICNTSNTKERKTTLVDSWSASPSSSRFFHDIRLSMKNIISCSIVFPLFWKLWQFSKKKGRLVHHRICSLISKNNLKFGPLHVSTAKQFNLYFHRMYSSAPSWLWLKSLNSKTHYKYLEKLILKEGGVSSEGKQASQQFSFEIEEWDLCLIWCVCSDIC